MVVNRPGTPGNSGGGPGTAANAHKAEKNPGDSTKHNSEIASYNFQEENYVSQHQLIVG